MTEQPKISKEVLSSKVINKSGSNGQVYSSVAVEVILYNNSKVIQLTQTKQKRLGNDTILKKSIVTLDPKNKELKEALSEAYKI